MEDKEKYMVLDMGGNDLGLTFTIMSLIQSVILKISENNVARNRSSEVNISNALIQARKYHQTCFKNLKYRKFYGIT